jgi:hypothetical protein
MNFLIETKQEYTIHLVNSMYPLIYEGLQSIYEDARKMSTSNDELVNFQRLLKAIPSWNPMMIESEYNRILRMNTLGKTIEDLLKAVIKANIVVLTNTNIEYDEKLLKELNIQDDFKSFLHLVYIECARNFYNSPYLFYHKNTDLDIKRHQTEILENIKLCIQNAIRKMIPLQITIKTYLDNKNTKIPTDINSETEQLKKLLHSDKNFRGGKNNTDFVTPSSPRKLHEILATTVKSEEYKNPFSLIKDNSKILQFSEKTLRDSILDINTEDIKQNMNKNQNVFLNSKVKSKPTGSMSESSVYYDNSKNNLIEEYTNNLSPLEEKDDSSEQKRSNADMPQPSIKLQTNNLNREKGHKYFSNLNV